jgi:murein DD-endopeptidase MepM/ murein hydrolase activator NlpD
MFDPRWAMDLSTDNKMILFGIDGEIYRRSEVIAEREGRTVTEVVEEQLRAWLGTTARDGGEDKLYIVQPGDTLVRIAMRFYGNPFEYARIAEYNGITEPDMFYEGQMLRIPPRAPVAAPPPRRISRPFRFPLAVTETSYFKFGSLYPPSSTWAGIPHPGVDFHEREGAPVYSIGEGIVLVNKNDPQGYGHYLMIEHTLAGTGKQVFSLYGHLQHDAQNGGGFRTPPVGTRLRGETIQVGLEGKTGQANGLSHVHFEIKKTSELGLYGQINVDNLHDYFYDPYEFIPNHEFLLL